MSATTTTIRGNNPDFDKTIGLLDFVLSDMIQWTKHIGPEVGGMSNNSSNRQTLKNHADRMISVGEEIIGILGDENPKLRNSPADWVLSQLSAYLDGSLVMIVGHPLLIKFREKLDEERRRGYEEGLKDGKAN